MQEKKDTPERFPCSGCAFSYTLVKASPKDAVGTLIRKHNSRTGPGLCPGAKMPPRGEETGQQSGADAFSGPAHVHDYQYGDDDNGHSGSFCTGCGGEEPGGDPAPYEECACGGTDSDCPNGCGQVDEDDPLPAVAAREAAHRFTDTSGTVWVHPGETADCVLPECVLARNPVLTAPDVVAAVPDDGRTPEQQAEIDRRRDDPIGSALATLPDPFQSPAAPPAPEPTVSGQPPAERDRWGRYVLPLGKGGKFVGTTRATTFAKSTSDTFNLSQWGDRMVIRGLTLRPDLLAVAHGLDVKRDRDAMNSIAEQAKEAAGNKVAANLGTALHAFTERLDAGVMQLQHAPPEYTHKLFLYQQTMQKAGLRTRPEWIERTTAVTVTGNRSGVQEEVAGTLDRIDETPGEDLVIVDLKTGADLSYGWGEIAVQLALYAHGVNQRGLYDHRTKTWHAMDRPVREDYAIVVHLPADPTDGGKFPDRQPWCQLYRVDLRAGWEAAALNADVRSWRKTKDLARPLLEEDLAPVGGWNPQEGVVEEPAAPVLSPAMVQASEALKNAREAQARWDNAVLHFQAATSKGALAQLWQHATDCGHFTPEQVQRLTRIGMEQLKVLEPTP